MDRPPRLVDPAESAPPIPTPEPPAVETSQPVAAEAGQPAAATVEKGPAVEKSPRAEEAFFEDFFNKRGDGLEDVREWIAAARESIASNGLKGAKKTQSIKNVDKLESVLAQLTKNGNRPTSRADRTKAERALKYLHDAGVIVLPEVVSSGEPVDGDTEDGATPDNLQAESEGEADDGAEAAEPIPTEPPTPTEPIAPEVSKTPEEELRESDDALFAESMDVYTRANASPDKRLRDLAATLISTRLEFASARSKSPAEADEARSKLRGALSSIAAREQELIDKEEREKREKAEREKTQAFEPLPSYDPNDWETILGVSRGVTTEELRNAYRRLSRKYHPDRHTGHPNIKDFEEAFKVITEAYDIAQGKGGGRTRYTPPPGSTGSGGTGGGSHGGSTPPPPGSGAPSGNPDAGPAPRNYDEDVFSGVSQEFESEFGISEADLLTVPGYADLTPGQKALLQERFKQVLLGKINEDAIGARRREEKKLTRLGRIFGRNYKMAKVDQSVARRVSRGGIDVHRQALEQLVAVTKANEDEAAFDYEGKLKVSYASGFQPRTFEQQEVISDLDNAAARLSHMPAEWSAATATLSQRREYASARKAYDAAREKALEMKQSESGDAVASALWMNKIDERVRIDQLIATHPEASEELQSIKDPTLWKMALKSIGTERIGYAAGGFITRSLTVAMFGAIAAPAISGIMGGLQARSRAKGALRESDQLARRGTKDKSKTAQNMIDSERKTRDKGIEVGAAAKLNRLVDMFESETDSVKRAVLIARIRERIDYTQQKIEDGKVNFGKSTDRVKNQLELSQALGRASVIALESPDHIGQTYAEELSDRVDGFMERRNKTVDRKRSSVLRSATAKGALISAGFGAAGYWLRHIDMGGHEGHGLLDSDGSVGAHESVHGGGAGGGDINLPEQETVGGVLAEKAAAQAGKTAESATTVLEIGNRGPEGSLIKYFTEPSHKDIATKFGWDGKEDIKAWAGTRAHQLWRDYAINELKSDKVQESLVKLGYTNDLEGYTKMMTRIKSGGVTLDVKSGSVTLSNMEYLKARSVGAASAEISAPEHVDAPVAAPESAASAAVEEAGAQAAPVPGVENVPAAEAEHAPGIPYDRDSAPRVGEDGIPFDRNPEVLREGHDGVPFDRNPGAPRFGHGGIPFDRYSPFSLDTSHMGLSEAITAHMEHDLTEIFGASNEGYAEYARWARFPVRQFLNLHIDSGVDMHADRLQAYVEYLEKESGVRPRAHILWFNEKIDDYIRRALRTIEVKHRRGL